MNKKIFEVPIDGSQGYLYFKHEELGLDLVKNFLTQRRFPDVYSTDGWINLGSDAEHMHSRAEQIFGPILRSVANVNVRLFVVPLYEKPFICYLDDGGVFKLDVVGYFDRANTVFEKVNYDKDVVATGLIEEVKDGIWDLIEI